MRIKIGYQTPYTTAWSITHVFKRFHEYCLENVNDIDFEYLNYDNHLDGNPSGLYSPHNMRLINEDTGKYIVVSYWDKAIEMTWEGNGWNKDMCVSFITSSGTDEYMNYTPFSYLPYSKFFSEYYVNAKPFQLKENTELTFRGFLYGQRLRLSELNKIKITNEKIYPEQRYFEDLTTSKICLSLNGAVEICNRDIEILSAGSILFRPILKQKFHNALIPGVHYVGYQYVEDANEQMDIILDEYNKIKDNEELLRTISNNGYEWFKNNGTIDKNVDLLKQLVNFDLLK
jgi:hypothetical protein